MKTIMVRHPYAEYAWCQALLDLPRHVERHSAFGSDEEGREAPALFSVIPSDVAGMSRPTLLFAGAGSCAIRVVAVDESVPVVVCAV